jgi:hypothetical protein
MTDHYVAYTLAGPSNLQQDIDTIEKLIIKSFSIDEPNLRGQWRMWLTRLCQ